MIHEKYSDLVTRYLQGTLNESEQKQFSLLIDEGEIDDNELKELEKTYLEMGAIDVPELSQQVMNNRFYSMLEAEKAKQSQGFNSRISVWMDKIKFGFKKQKFGYAAALFIAGLFIGTLYTPFSGQDEKIDQLTSEVYQMREMIMMSLLENDSPAERLRAVNISSEIPGSDNRVAEALLQTLNKDPNVNVRIAAVDALISHASNPNVRSGMIKSISGQQSPLVQIALADAMITLQERESVDQFKKLLEQDDMDTNVRQKLQNTILALN